MSGTKTFIAFALGAVTGALATWLALREHYAQKMRDERAALRETMRQTPKDIIKESGPEKPGGEDADAVYNEYAAKARKYNPTSYGIVPGSENGDEEVAPTIERIDPVKDYREPYVISTDEYAAMDGYEASTLTYFRDGILADENYDMITDIEDTIGNALERMDQYGEDCVYVRNERLRMDYEVVRNMRTYREILKQKPYLQ